MKTIIMYVSICHSNTRKVAETMRPALDADIINALDQDCPDIMDYDLVVLGSGIFHGKHHARLFKLIDVLPLTGKKSVIFSTSGKGQSGKYHKALRETLGKKECPVIGEFACKGLDTYGLFRLIGGINKKRPNQKDLDAALTFAKSIA